MGSIWAELEVRKEFDIPPDVSPIDYLLARMRDPRTDEHVRTKIAIALLPFTSPKLAVTASIEGKDFAALLEARLKKINGGRAKIIEAPKMADLDL